eukprot:m.763224 g.763224  ORF g.763224 m.763224 type:complete len:268 (+) comp23211_c0_seq36:638-1441(+)
MLHSCQYVLYVWVRLTVNDDPLFYMHRTCTSIMHCDGQRMSCYTCWCFVHQGFELWPSNHSWNWNALDVGPKADLVGAFLMAMRKQGLHAGLYHSVFEWFNPLLYGPNPSDYVTQKLIPDLYDIVNIYEPDMLLMDGEWNHPSDFWQTRPFLQWLYNDSPVKDKVVTDDRWGNECRGKHGGVFICENGGFSAFCSGSGAAGTATMLGGGGCQRFCPSHVSWGKSLWSALPMQLLCGYCSWPCRVCREQETLAIMGGPTGRHRRSRGA